MIKLQVEVDHKEHPIRVFEVEEYNLDDDGNLVMALGTKNGDDEPCTVIIASGFWKVTSESPK